MSTELRDYELALRLRKHPRTIQRWCKAGRLPGAYKAGRTWLIPRAGLSAAGLPEQFAGERIEGYLAAATVACESLSEELDQMKRGRRSVFPRDWRLVANQLRDLERALGGLSERASKVASDFSRRTGPVGGDAESGVSQGRRSA